MDSPVVSQFFRQLLTTPSRHCLRLPSCAASQGPLNTPPRRSYVWGRKRGDEDGGSRWQQRIDAFPKDMSKQLREYPKVTSLDLRNRLHRPRRVKMLARDFVEGQLTLQEILRWVDLKQTAYTIPITDTSPNTQQSLIPENLSTSQLSRMKQSSTEG
jgi:hypothetical protein